MADTITNLKVRFGADTKNFKADLESGKAAVDKFSSAGKSAFSNFAKVFGINIDGISSQLSGASKTLSVFNAGMKGSPEAAGFFAAAMRIVKLALASTGVMFFVIAIASLITYFTKTSEGANFVKRSLASFGAVVRELTDRFSDLGKFLFDAFSKPKESISDLWEFIKTNLVNRITAIPLLIESAWKIVKGIFSGGVGDAAKDFASAMTQLGTGLDKVQQNKVVDYVKGVGKAMGDEAQQAWNLAQATQDLAKRERELRLVQAQRKDEISQLLLKSRDIELSDKERLAAMDKAIKLTKEVGATEASVESERLRILKAQQDMGKLMGADKNALVDQQVKLQEVYTNTNNEIRGMMRYYNSLAKEVRAETEAEQANRIEKEKAASKGLTTLDPTTQPVKFKLVTDEKGNQSWLKNAVDSLETDKLTAKSDKIKSIFGDLKTTVTDFSQVFNESISGIATGFGESLGAMLAGTGTLGDIGNVVLSSLADLAIQVGKIAIGVGLATFGIKAALQSLNPVLAIAAGVALVALGSAAKGALSKSASGGGTFSSASTSSYGSVGSSGSTGSLRAAPMTINITGEFRQSGKDLVAVIDKNSQRKYITT